MGRIELALLVSFVLSACQSHQFLERPEEVDESHLAVLQLGSDGAPIASTPISWPGRALEAELSELPGTRTFLYALSPASLGALYAVGSRAGLDGPTSSSRQPVAPARGCAPTYPAPERVYELMEDRWVSVEEAGALPALTAPWLLESCEPAVEPPSGFVSSIALSSSCGACPSSQLEQTSACVYRLKTDAALCSSATDQVTLRRDWRDELCVEEAATCRSTGGASFRCGAEPDVCELELRFETYTEEDRFAVSDEVVGVVLPPSPGFISTPGFWVGARHTLLLLNRYDPTRARCEDRSSTRLDLYDLESAAFVRSLPLPGCVLAVTEGRDGASVLFVSVTPEEVFQLIEIDLLGEELARSHLDPVSALGLTGLDAATVSFLIPWATQGGWVAGFSQVGRRARPGALLFFRGVGAGQDVEFGPRFTIPEGGFPTRILEAGPSGPGLYMVSGGNWAFAATPSASLVFESLGGFDTRFPTPRDLAVGGDGRAWIVGAFGQSAAVVPLQPGSGARAFVSEVAASAAVMARWGTSMELVVSFGAGRSYATRFDPTDARFLPGTLELAVSSGTGSDDLLTGQRAVDGSIWLLYRDGRLRRVRKP